MTATESQFRLSILNKLKAVSKPEQVCTFFGKAEYSGRKKKLIKATEETRHLPHHCLLLPKSLNLIKSSKVTELKLR